MLVTLIIHLLIFLQEGNADMAQLLLDYGAEPLQVGALANPALLLDVSLFFFQANAKHGASALHFAKSVEASIIFYALNNLTNAINKIK